MGEQVNHQTDAEKLTAIRQIAEDAAGLAGMDDAWPPAWAEEVLADAELVAGDGEAARMVSYIRADEVPHVEYLKTTLSEMRDRTFITESGGTASGADILGRLWETAKGNSLGARRTQLLDATLAEIRHTLKGNPRSDDILEQFHALGSVRPGPDGWVSAAAA